MRKLPLVIVLAAAALSTAVPTAGDASASFGQAFGLRLPPGWHVIHRRLTYVIYPVQRLAAASFKVRLARHPCNCGQPAVRDFPPKGAFLFVWEWTHYPADGLHLVPRRPRRFDVSEERGLACTDLVWSTSFRESRRVFDVEVYLGPAAGPAVRARMEGLLDSLRIAPPQALAPRSEIAVPDRQS